MTWAKKQPYENKFPYIIDKTGFCDLTPPEQSFVQSSAFQYQFTHQELKAIELEPKRFYHIGTGQSCDARIQV
jgi:hypothetical protein